MVEFGISNLQRSSFASAPMPINLHGETMVPDKVCLEFLNEIENVDLQLNDIISELRNMGSFGGKYVLSVIRNILQKNYNGVKRLFESPVQPIDPNYITNVYFVNAYNSFKDKVFSALKITKNVDHKDLADKLREFFRLVDLRKYHLNKLTEFHCLKPVFDAPELVLTERRITSPTVAYERGPQTAPTPAPHLVTPPVSSPSFTSKFLAALNRKFNELKIDAYTAMATGGGQMVLGGLAFYVLKSTLEMGTAARSAAFAGFVIGFDEIKDIIYPSGKIFVAGNYYDPAGSADVWVRKGTDGSLEKSPVRLELGRDSKNPHANPVLPNVNGIPKGYTYYLDPNGKTQIEVVG